MSVDKAAFASLGSKRDSKALLFGVSRAGRVLSCERVAVTQRTRTGVRRVTIHNPDGTLESLRVAWGSDLTRPALYGPVALTILEDNES